jgi:UDP-glucose 4-epimerase
MDKILVTGSSGGIGSVLVPILCARGYKVFGLDLKDPIDPLEDPNFSFYKGSINNVSDLLGAVKSEIDYVIHLAAISSLPECEANSVLAMETNFIGTINLVTFFTDSNIKGFVNASTSAIYENETTFPFVESSICDPNLIYSQSKINSENFLIAQKNNRNFPSVSLRFFNVIGPNQDYNRASPPLLNYIVREFLAKRRPILYAKGEQGRDYISVYDVCEAVIESMKLCSLEDSIFNICSGDTISVKEIVQIIQQSMKCEIEPVYRDPHLLWEHYSSLFDGNFPLRELVVQKETLKKSVGDPSRFISATSWRVKFPARDMIPSICSDAIKFISGR